MIQTNLQSPGFVASTIIDAKYQDDPLALYKSLTENKTNTLLLESAEISDKRALKSLLLVDAAVKVECSGFNVTVSAKSLNGQSVLELLADRFSQDKYQSSVTINKQSEQFLSLTFIENNEQQDELSRLLTVNPMQVLRELQTIESIEQHPFAVFIGGAFAFDLITISEQLPEVDESTNTCPDYVYYLAETLIIIDHQKQNTEIIGNVFSGKEQAQSQNQILKRIEQLKDYCEQPLLSNDIKLDVAMNSADVKVNITDSEFCQQVDDLKEHIRAGDIFQVVPSRTFSLPCTDPISAYQALKLTNPSPYMFFLKDDDFCLFGASPESALKFSSDNRQVELYPIAGTRPRGFNLAGEYSPDLDGRIELELRNDEKEKAEHLMLVDLARNDIARVSEGGTRYVAELLKVDRYSQVMHLVSRVCGTLSQDLDALHAYQACMNMGTLSGAPKVKATQLIRQIEGSRRGSYGGAVGYLNGEGDMDTCIVIRSAFVKSSIAYVQAGAGVVYDSDPQSEADETRQKAQAVIKAVQIANAAENLLTK
ncbi:anthranilate synthase component 1 [Thalassomonas sp. M1454]|uniref:anthranilate synthase component 1 n=1 Tax=Thalassomonas sp. M1454 TaxID=2594477 RepID=UPI00118087C5|nr:anthranilate synthase component 1 [Thalassomonas sp. M1454]TRX55732.1 anthranilate synthase component 1 [Thalassomonas sp. M1454]